MTGHSERAGQPFAMNAEEAARLAREVQKLGFDSARTVVDRFVELFGRFCATIGNDPSGIGQRIGGAGPAVRIHSGNSGSPRIQSDMQRTTESYLSIIGQLSDASLLFLDAARSWGSPAPTPDAALVLPDIAPGGWSSARLWLHNTTASTVTNLRPWSPGLAGHAGDALPLRAVTFSPERIERLDSGESREVVVAIRPGEAAVPGAYHGQVLIERLPEAVFPLAVRVVPRSPSW
jgi:hypothetical protein